MIEVLIKVLVFLAAKVVFHHNIKYVFDPLGFQLSQSFLFVTVNKRSTPDDSLAGIESPVRAGCDRAASQVFQLVDYVTLNSRSNLQKKVAISKSSVGFD